MGAYTGARGPPERYGHLVVLSGAGMPVRKRVQEAVHWYAGDIISVT